VDGDANGRGASGGDHSAGDKLGAAVPAEPQDRDLVAAGIYREQVAAVAAELQCALGSQAGTRPDATGRERRTRHRCERTVGVAVEGPDRVLSRCVVI
jgi:hypothetical protein